MSTPKSEVNPLVSQRLPINDFKGTFVDAFAASQCILINTSAGSGASTQIPQWSVELAKSSGKLVASAHPRRLAAVSLAALVATEMEVELGKEVGYAIRHEERGGSVLKYCTDGWLLREMEKDQLLLDYGVIIVDGVHERTLHIDVLLGKLKALLTQRTDLKIVVIGEDLDTHKFMVYFNNHYLISTLPRVESPPTIVHAPHQCLLPVESAIENVCGLEEKEGNILVLLATSEEVEKACKEIGRRVEGLVCIPLHPGGTLEELALLRSIEGRKCIISTGSGESSAVIFEGISIVIDGGFCETDFYDQVESKQVIPISKTTADRRAARAGVKKVVRVYSKDFYEKMEKENLPVILRADPKRVREVLKENGVDMDTIDLIDKPSTGFEIDHMESSLKSHLLRPRPLPIDDFKDIFIAAHNSPSQCIIINDRAGSGASTEIPQWAVELTKGSGKHVVCAQPRRLAAVSMATRVTDEMSKELGKEVGYAIRDEERGGSLLKFCSDGWLLREMDRDPYLNDYSFVIVDGVHERTLNIDILVYELRELLIDREDLKIVVIGEALDSIKWMNFFNRPSLIVVPRSSIPPSIIYSPHSILNSVDTAIETVVDLHKTEKKGDILVYLATPEEVEKVCEELPKKSDGIHCVPLHSQLPFDALKRLNAPVIGRRVIVSTNIGETSFIFDEVSIVVDCGRCQMDVYDAITGVKSKQIVPISKATAERRAAREGVKKVVRLYSEDEYKTRENETLSEVLRASPERAKQVLLGQNGIDENTFDYIDKPVVASGV